MEPAQHPVESEQVLGSERVQRLAFEAGLVSTQGPHERRCAVARHVRGTVVLDRAYHQRLVNHYEQWKRVVDDERHPDHAKVRSSAHDDATHTPAFPRRELSQRHGVKVGANDKCPCGSGRKYKKCCRQ